jgi:hypothetical protein
MRFLYAFIGCAFLVSANAKTQQARKIIDVHFHATLSNDFGKTSPLNPVTGKKPAYKTDQEVVDIMMATLKKNNVVKVIVSGNLNTVPAYQKADSTRVIPSLGYSNLPDTLTFIRLFTEKKFTVFGELGLQYIGKTLADPELEPYLSICERMGIPVALHTGLAPPNTPYTCCPEFRTALGNPQLIEEVLVKHPRLKIQLMHMGFPYLAETLAIMYMYPQVYTDIGAVDWILPVPGFYSYLKSLIENGLGSRIMYGSDQMAWDDAIPLSIKNVENAPFLTEAQKQDIFYNNAARFYNIK